MRGFVETIGMSESVVGSASYRGDPKGLRLGPSCHSSYIVVGYPLLGTGPLPLGFPGHLETLALCHHTYPNSANCVFKPQRPPLWSVSESARRCALNLCLAPWSAPPPSPPPSEVQRQELPTRSEQLVPELGDGHLAP